jgi:hypothetical protein
LAVRAKDGDARFVHEVLVVLTDLAEQIAFNGERASLHGLGAFLLDVNATDGLFACGKFGLRTGLSDPDVAVLDGCSVLLTVTSVAPSARRRRE